MDGHWTGVPAKMQAVPTAAVNSTPCKNHRMPRRRDTAMSIVGTQRSSLRLYRRRGLRVCGPTTNISLRE